MKKLYRKGSVHPSPPLKSDHLSFLPATILTLTVALSPEDRQVLAYLISCSSSSNFSGNQRKNSTTTTTTPTPTNNNNNNNSSSSSSTVDHPPSFNCYCFRCYMSYWVRWDSSPNRQLIHEIIDAYEDGLSMQIKKEKSSRKDRRKSSKGCSADVVGSGELKRSELTTQSNMEFTDQSSKNPMEEDNISTRGSREGDDGGVEEEMGKGFVRRFVSFLGQKIWGVWT